MRHHHKKRLKSILESLFRLARSTQPKPLTVSRLSMPLTQLSKPKETMPLPSKPSSSSPKSNEKPTPKPERKLKIV